MGSFRAANVPLTLTLTLTLALASVLLSELEGRGHSCLVVTGGPRIRGPRTCWRGQKSAAGRRRAAAESLKGWLGVSGANSQIWHAGEVDYDKLLVLNGERLYLLCYWRDESLVAGATGAGAHGRRAVDPVQIAVWLGRLFDPQQLLSADSARLAAPGLRHSDAAKSPSLPAERASERPTWWRACWRRLAAAAHRPGGTTGQVTARQSSRWTGRCRNCHAHPWRRRSRGWRLA